MLEKVQPNNHQIINNYFVGFRISTQPTGDRISKKTRNPKLILELYQKPLESHKNKRQFPEKS